jgi:hypothetical protein
MLMNYKKYQRMKQTLDVLSDPAAVKQMAQSKRFYCKGLRERR